jgi:hypothetical protein
MEQVLVEKLIVVQLVKKYFRLLCNPKFITVFTIFGH